MRMSTILAAVKPLALGLWMAYGLAPGAASAQEPERGPQSQAPQSAPEEDKAASNGEQASTAGAQPTTPGEATSPFDYEATEQISEDLSVSFPVDI